MQRDRTITISILIFVLCLAGLYTWTVIEQGRKDHAANNPAAHALTVTAGEQPFTDLSGTPISLTEHVGKVLIVNVWASWSPDSASELPLLAAHAAMYADHGVTVIGINRAESQTTAERFLNSVGAAQSVQLVLDPADRYYYSIEGFAMPETVFYDAQGNIVHHHRGPLTQQQLVEYTEAALRTE